MPRVNHKFDLMTQLPKLVPNLVRGFINSQIYWPIIAD